MSHIDLESFRRLEEFPSFISCIHSFGRPIIPPLVTPNHVHELRQLRASAISKEAEILGQRKHNLREKRDDQTLSMLLEIDCKSDYLSNAQDSCALWYPSYHDKQEVSVAISKFPTTGIYSSVHTDAIVCSNVVGSKHTYNSNIVKDDAIDVGPNMADYNECSHSNINLDCSLCLAELNENICSKSFSADLSPEVPCRTFSLCQHGDFTVMEEGLNAIIEDSDSTSAVISNQRNIHLDTDSESNTTCMTQSTDLEKYMELSYDFNSPDSAWDSKTSSQHHTLSRSDDASSETIVNTENELTPCASTMAELTDNLEDEFSNAEEVAGSSNNNNETTGEMKRAHSVDSYMKILQNCSKNQNVKKSQSEPFNTNKLSNSDDINAVKTSKMKLLIKEDSKESEEAKDVPEKDYCAQENVRASMKDDKAAEANKTNSKQKKHVRQNSYTLDHPSSALILAHADCTCQFDTNCISPHCSALKDTNEVLSNSAFVKEKVDIAPPSQMKILPILISEKTSKDAHFSKEENFPTVVDIFPNVKEDSCEKSDSGNIKKACDTGHKEESKLDIEECLSENFLENLNISNQPKHLEYIQHICDELKSNHELRVKELREEQNKQWLKLEEEFKDQERLLYEKLIVLESSKGFSSKNEDDVSQSNSVCCKNDKRSEDKCVLQNELLAPHSFGTLSDQIPTSDSSSSIQASTSLISNKYSSSFSSPEISVLPENARALSPSTECMSSDKNPSIPTEGIKTKQFLNETHNSMISLKNSDDPICITSESVSEVNGFLHSSSLVPRYNSLPEYQSAIAVPIYANCDKMTTCFCDNTFQSCRCCMSLNGYPEYNVSSSPPYSLISSQEQNSVSFNSNTNSQSDSIVLRKQSPPSGIKNIRVDSADLNSSLASVKISPQKSNDCISTTQNDVLRSFENGELPGHQEFDKDVRRSLSLSTKQKYLMGNLVSLYANPSKNGDCIPHDRNFKKKMNIDPILMKKFEKLPAFVKGYLTRCLLRTDYVQNLIKTFKDTALLIGKMTDDLPGRRDPLSQGDIDFQRQLIVLLMSTYDNFYDTFFAISTKEQMSIIAESRNCKLKATNIGQEQESTSLVTTKASDLTACKSYKLSSATLKVLERKKRPTLDSRTYNVLDLRKARSRSVLDMRTYTIDDLPSFKGRAQSSVPSKSISDSFPPVSKSSAGLKRKTASAKSSGSKGCVHQKWVP